jgi:hypothetical protein
VKTIPHSQKKMFETRKTIKLMERADNPVLKGESPDVTLGIISQNQSFLEDVRINQALENKKIDLINRVGGKVGYSKSQEKPKV